MLDSSLPQLRGEPEPTDAAEDGGPLHQRLSSGGEARGDQNSEPVMWLPRTQATPCRCGPGMRLGTAGGCGLGTRLGTAGASSRVRHRVLALQVLEKVRPLDQKLRYQIDKLIRTATTGLAGTYHLCIIGMCEGLRHWSGVLCRCIGGVNDPLCFKPNPSNLVSKVSIIMSTLRYEFPVLWFEYTHPPHS